MECLLLAFDTANWYWRQLSNLAIYAAFFLNILHNFFRNEVALGRFQMNVL